MLHYLALIHKEPDSDFGVSFPDLPGCITAGSTLSEASAMAVEALDGHIEFMADEGEAIPEPSSIDAIMARPEYRDGIAILIPVKTRSHGQAVQVDITVSGDMLAQIDAEAERRGISRSSFLTQAAKREIEAA